MPSINVENAEIKTASVEIKTLIVSKRQVTLSLFRQIPEEKLIDDNDLRLNGIPWGRINYFWKMQYNEDDYIHIVWQQGTELKRSIVLDKISTKFQYCTGKYENMIINKIENESIIKKINDTGYYFKKNILCNDIDDTDNIPTLRYYLEHTRQISPESRENAEKRIEFLTETEQKLNTKILDIESSCHAYGYKYKRLIQSLQELPQLFIAV